MPLRFEDVHLTPLRGVSLDFEGGTIAGLAGPDGSGKGTLLRLAAGRAQPEKGTVAAPAGSVLVELGPGARDELRRALETNPPVLLIDHALAILDAAAQAQCVRELDRLRRRDAVILIASHDLALLERVSDVVIAIEEGRVVEQGDPGLVLARYRTRMAGRIRAAAGPAILSPSSRHGDGRVEIASLEILGADEKPAANIRSGEKITVRARLRFREPVENPVAGILIRTRIGVSVYGTNTELEQTPIGPRRRDERVEVDFQFPCNLCPQDYTLTAASHDPDGTAHEWLEEALRFTVIDDRPTAGVANLRATVSVR